MLLYKQLLSQQNLNNAFLSKTNTVDQGIVSNLIVSGGSVTLKNSIITDNASSSYLRIDPQGNQVIVYDGVNNQQLSVFSSSGSESIYLSTINGANNTSYGLLDVTNASSIASLKIGTSSGKPLIIGGEVTLQNTNLGINLNGADAPLITRGWDAFTSGKYNGIGKWGLFMEPSTITIGANASNGNFQFALYNADSSIASVPFHIDTNSNIGVGTTANRVSSKLDIQGGGGVLIGKNLQLNNPIADGTLMIGDTTRSYSGNASGETWDSNGSQLVLHSKDYGMIGFLSYGNRLEYIRAGMGLIDIGYDGGWGRSLVQMGTGNILNAININGTNIIDSNRNLNNIGTISSSSITASGQLQVNTSVNSPAVLLQGATAGWASGIQFNNTTASTGRKYGIYSGSDGSFHITDETGAVSRLWMDNTGKISIGNSAPSWTLDIAGDIHASATGRIDGKAYIQGGSGFGGSPAISLAVGDTDTGLNWASDGKLQWYSNNVNMIEVYSNGNYVNINNGATLNANSVKTTGAVKIQAPNDYNVNYYPNVVACENNGTVTGGWIIHTPIPRTSDIMFKIRVHGYWYGQGDVVDCEFVGYVYAASNGNIDGSGGAITNYSCVDNGNENWSKYIGIDGNGNLALAIGDTGSSIYYGRLSVDAWITMTGGDYSTGWSIDQNTTTNFGWKDIHNVTTTRRTSPNDFWVNGIMDAGSQYQLGGTQIVDSNRNLTNIASVNSSYIYAIGGESHFALSSYSDPYSGTGQAIKFAGGIAGDTSRMTSSYNTLGSYQINGTTVIDSSRNIVNAGNGNFGNTVYFAGNSSNPSFRVGGLVTFSTLQGKENSSGQDGALVIRNLAELRFSDSSAWDWNSWAGIQFKQASNLLSIGGPNGTAFQGSSAPPNITVNFDGVSALQMGGTQFIDSSRNITLNQYLYGSNGTIAASYDGWLRLNDGDHHGSGIYCGSTILRTDGQLQVGGNGQYFLALNGNTYSNGVFNGATGFQVNGTTVIDGSRNLTNIGTINSGAITTTGITNSGTITNSASSACIEHGSQTASNTPHIDFHSSGFSNDYDSRIIANGGSSGNVGGGTLQILSAEVDLASTNLKVMANGDVNQRGTIMASTRINNNGLEFWSQSTWIPTMAGNSAPSDLNNCLTAGTWYFSPSTLNLPSAWQGVNYGIVVNHVSNGIIHDNSTNWIWQYAFNTANQDMYVRQKINNGGWGPWTQVGGGGMKPRSTKVWTGQINNSTPITLNGTGRIIRVFMLPNNNAYYNLTFTVDGTTLISSNVGGNAIGELGINAYSTSLGPSWQVLQQAANGANNSAPMDVTTFNAGTPSILATGFNTNFKSSFQFSTSNTSGYTITLTIYYELE